LTYQRRRFSGMDALIRQFRYLSKITSSGIRD
jgi:hypothetical protein